MPAAKTHMNTENHRSYSTTRQIPGWLIALFSILAFLAILLVLEIALRLLGITNPIRYEPVPSADLFAHDDTLGWVLRANANSPHATYEYSVRYTIDSLGHRLTPSFVFDSDFHLLCLGGSLTFGHGLNDEDTFPNHLAELADAKVWNLGVQGYATDQSLLQLQRALRVSTPDLVILSYIPSHIERNACLPKWMDKLSDSYRSKPVFKLDNGNLALEKIPGPSGSEISPRISDRLVSDSTGRGFFLS